MATVTISREIPVKSSIKTVTLELTVQEALTVLMNAGNVGGLGAISSDHAYSPVNYRGANSQVYSKLMDAFGLKAPLSTNGQAFEKSAYLSDQASRIMRELAATL